MVDRSASVLGLLTAPYSLLQSFKAIWNHFHSYLHNDRRNLRLQDLTSRLQDTIGPTKSGSSRAADHIYDELHSVLKHLQCIKQRSTRMLSASSEHLELEQIEQKLERLDSQIVVVKGTLELASTVCNDSIELPSPEVGLIRGEEIWDFVQRSHGQDFRVIAIHGQPGVGKTTLLNYVWDKISRKVPLRFARAYVQIGHDATSSTILKSQTSILRQLGGNNKEFPGDGFGTAELSKHFQQLKQPLFLAIDNVFEVQDLERLLPMKLGRGNLPTASCVVVTCRNYRIVEALVTNICGLKVSEKDRVMCYEPPCLNDEESRRVFAECAGMKDSASKHEELLDALVPLCDGLPLALTVFGKVFVDEGRREKAEWQLIREQWATLDDEDDEYTSPVIKTLQLSFDRLGRSRQIAFLDMVSMFYGWPWESVERILNVSIMRELQNSSLVRKVDDINKCNQSALRKGYDWGYYNQIRKGNHVAMRHIRSRVSMHDLTLRFGESILHANKLEYRQYVRRPVEDHQLSKLRHLIMSEKSDAQELVEHATGLRMLALLQHYDSYRQTGHYMRYCDDTGSTEDCFQASRCNESSGSKQDVHQLHYLMVERCKWSRSILGMKVSHELRELILKGCIDLIQLPNIPLPNLEVLDIKNCPEFEGFPASCVKGWGRLKDFYLRNCPFITVIPEDLGSLPSLRRICIKFCRNLEKFPSLSSPNGPSSLKITHCPRLHTVGDMLCPLESLWIYKLPAIMKLPVSIFNISSLQTLSIRNCEGLVELLPDQGDITNCRWSPLLKLFAVRSCQGLRRLPAGIFQAASDSLIELDLEDCRYLEKLPDSITSITSLKRLDLGGCVSLTELPQEIGGLGSLSKLDMSGCSKLEKLPDSMIAGMTSLEVLRLAGCKGLTELPNLPSLRELTLGSGGCGKPENLPGLLSSCSTSLEQLRLIGNDDDESPTEFPLAQIVIAGGLCSNLKRLTLFNCRKVEKLPEFLFRITSLETLNLDWCPSLTELPQEIGGLCSLKHLGLFGCKKLEKIPDTIATLTSLEFLSLTSCESLMAPPQEIGALSCLRYLWLEGCEKLEKLPDSITSITSLEILHVSKCKRIVGVKEIAAILGLNATYEGV